MQKLVATALFLLLPATAIAAEDAASTADAPASASALDLSLPKPSAYAYDPPGTYYRHSPGYVDEVSYSRCPTAPDGSERDLTGNVRMGIANGSRIGTMTHTGATLNYCKQTVDEDGDERVFNVQLNVDQIDGGDARPMRRGPGRGPRGF